jgi:hypothetical protein
MRADPTSWDELAPFSSGWRSARSPYTGFYGGSLEDLPDVAARFDVSLAWHPWVGAQASLEFLTSFDAEYLRQHTVDLACLLARKLGLEPTGSSILGIAANEQLDQVKQAFASAGIVVSFPSGQIRTSFHVYNDVSDVEYIASVLTRALDLASSGVPSGR